MKSIQNGMFGALLAAIDGTAFYFLWNYFCQSQTKIGYMQSLAIAMLIIGCVRSGIVISRKIDES